MENAAQRAPSFDTHRELRPGGEALRRADLLLRWGLALALTVFALDTRSGSAGSSAALICAAAHAIPRAPRGASLLSLALGLWATLEAASPTALGAGLIGGSAVRLALYLGDRGRWLLRIHTLEQQRRRARVGTGLAAGHGALIALAGDLYEEAGFARRALVELGARPRRSEAWRIFPTRMVAWLVAPPGWRAGTGRGVARCARALAARASRARPRVESISD
jgi:hypothetical protein